ncbi:cytochrome P450 [Cadophora sp. DSE1049]|nr:cytochrome P450 [Cadophora sp. DSE1049]
MLISKRREHSRQMLRPQFSRDQVADLELEERHVQELFRCIPIETSGWTTEIDLGPLFFRLTLDSATEFLFGESVHSQLSALSDGHSSTGGRTYNSKVLANSFDRGTSALGIRARLGTFFWMYSPQTFKDDCAEVHRFANSCVEKVLTKRASGENAPENGRYIFLEELAKVTQNPVELRSQLLNILLAGRDTTAGLLGWTFWSLVQNPEIYEKLRAAVLESFGPYGESTKTITHGGLKSCSYLQYVLSESLRLYPSVPINARSAVRDTCLPRGGGPDGMSPVYVKKGTEVAYFVYIMHRRKDIWGPDAHLYKPERWINRKHSWNYLPFNGGPRVCLGQQFALTEAGYVLARMVQRFDKLERRDFDDTELHAYGLTTSPKQVVLKLHQAGNGT